MKNNNVVLRFYSSFIIGSIKESILNLGGQFLCLGLLELGNLGGRLASKASTSPVFPDFVAAFVEVGLDGLNQFVERAAIVGLNRGESEASAGLPPGDASEPGFVLDDAVGDAHLAAKGGEEQNELNGIDIVGNDDELSLLFLDKPRHVVDSLTDDGSALGGSILLSSGPGFGASNQPLLLGLTGFWAVLVHQLEQLSRGLSIQGLVELVDWRGNLEPGLEDGLLALQPDVFGPFDESGEIPLRLDGLADAEVSGSFLEERIDDSLYLGLLNGQGGGGYLLSLLLGFLLNHFGLLLHLL